MHTPVLYGEVISALQPRAGGFYLDVTVGGGGHAEGILEACAPDGFLLGTDADAGAIERSAQRLSRFGTRAVLRQSWLDEAPALAQRLGYKAFDGILADLGLSSNQLDDPSRGFAFMRDGPLDMRFDSRRGLSAAELINRSDVAELTQLLRENGEVERAGQVAEAIWESRPITTTAQLRDAVSGVARSRGRIHPATQVFQALRIAVNDELRRLKAALPLLFGLLSPGGRLAVITFHSLEDRIVTQAFREASQYEETQDGSGMQVQRVNAAMRRVNKKPITPSEAEVEVNPRARSAKLRVIEKPAS